MMHVLYLLNEFPKLSESFVINEIYELERLGHEVSIISFRAGETDVEHDELTDLRATVIYLPAPSLTSALGALRGPLDVREAFRQARLLSTRETLGSTYIASHVNRAIRRLPREPDHIHTHFFDWPKFSLGHLRLEAPTTVTAHAFGLFSVGTDSQRRALADHFDRIVTISKYNRNYLRESIGVSTPVEVVRMGIRPEKFAPSDDSVDGRLLTVARFVEKKGIEYAIDAVGSLIHEYPDIEYRLVGSGPCEGAFQNQIRDHGLGDHVHVIGRVSDKRLVRELDEASAFLLPCVVAKDGDRDGIPVALMEAMAMRTVPISTTVSGIPELIDDGSNGFLGPPRDSSKIRKSLRFVLDNEAVSARMGNRARRTVVQEFNATRQAKAMERVFTECDMP